MEHKTQDEIRNIAEVLPSSFVARPLSKRERLELWAQALDREGGRCLTTLVQTEYLPPAQRARLRSEDSALTVAFKDRRLRADGLAGDSWGDATAYFGISDPELHNILCSCHYGETVRADVAAARVRAAAIYDVEGRSLFASWIIAGGLGAALIALGSVLV